MKRTIVILVPVFVVAAAFLLAVVYGLSSKSENAPVTSKLMSIENFVSLNINEFSPEKAVLGGTFHVTEISAADGKGVVSYEDGHVAYTADFTYTATDQTGIQVTSFTIR